MPSNTASMLHSEPHNTASRSDSWESGHHSELEEGEERSETSLDKEPDATFVEMLQAIKALLEIQDPECDRVHPPCAFNKRLTAKTTKRQLSAFPPEEDVGSMWAYRASQASGKDSNGVLYSWALQDIFCHTNEWIWLIMLQCHKVPLWKRNKCLRVLVTCTTDQGLLQMCLFQWNNICSRRECSESVCRSWRECYILKEQCPRFLPIWLGLRR